MIRSITHVIKHQHQTPYTRVFTNITFVILLLLSPIFAFGQNISLDEDGDGELNSGDPHESLNGNPDSGVYEHIGDITFKSGVNFSNKLQAETILNPGSDDSFNNYVIIDGNLTVEGGSTVSINNNSLVIVTGNVIIDGDIDFHNSGYIVILGDVIGSGTITPGSGGSALPAYIGGTVDSESIISSGNVDSPVNIDAAFGNGQTVTDILDFALPADWATNLPVELISFTASKTDGLVQLNWATASEVNASHFEIYSSTDRRNWSFIGEVEANGNTSTRIDYSFSDSQEHRTTIYYKLIQYDFDGQNETFGPLTVHFSNDQNNFQTSIYPNPSSTGKTSLQISGMNSNTNTILQVINKEGKVVLYDIIDTNNITSTIYQLGEKVALQPGLYILKVNSGTSQNIEKIMIQ
ncbi:T9SS type A sorting domain-containing protein [Flammeovirga sp. EKP202]|uniref:T9SS type A sorting domain-containing protein n=1 Tax=Flammeovirga sp. EKP202 TaxID=2770592 RepID=UPI00165F9069|nr:T9SS type A sorting domain-containing protein [Flammeovirga sp. EKP202]MBD0402550.1 T9SS type A sorting domain-containing protein [Flammeovirga sp. EKP202]